MKLATKKFFHNLLAMAVSVCMVCTLTPSAAWATGDGDSQFTSNGDSTATGESIVKAKVVSEDFNFDSITDPMNYDSKDDFVTAITGGHPLQATMKDSGIPDSYTVEWFIQEVKENENFDSTKDPGKDNPKTILVGEATKIFSKQYTKANTPKTSTVPTFEYPNQGNDGVIVAPSALSMDSNKRYEFSIIMTDADNAQAHASTQISLLADYPPQVITSEDYPEISVKGDIYQDFKIPPAVSVIEVTPIPEGNQTFQDIQAEAIKHTPVSETIEEAIQIDLINDALDPNTDNPYEGTLEVRIPIPDSLKDADPAPAKGDTVNVYVMDDEGNVTVKKGTIDEALDVNGDPIIDPETGEPIPVVMVEISGTGSGLGTFAVGIPVGGTYNVTTIAQSGGMITPSSEEGGTIKMPLGASSTFSTYAATPGYIFNGFEMKVGTKTVALRAEDQGFNTVTINPANYPDIVEGSTVTLTARYGSMALGRGTVGVTASLINGTGAGGDYKISTIETNTIKDRTVTPTARLTSTPIDMAAGLLLEFRPNNSSRIKSVTINGKVVAVQGDSLMISAATSALDIVVEYEKGQREVPTTKESIDISVGKRPNGTMPAQLVNPATGEQGSTLNLEVGPGGTVYFEATPIKDEYVLKEVLVYSPAGSSTPVNIYNHVTPSPNSNGEYPNDKITLYNVVNDVEIELKYELLPGVFEPATPSEGGEWGWIIPDNAANRNAAANAKPMAMRARAATATYANTATTYSGSVSRAGDTLHKGQFQLNQGERARLIIYPEKGYELSDVYINGDPVKSLLKLYTDNDGNSYYALTVYRGEPGSGDGQGAWTGDGFSGEQVDQIYYAGGSVSTTTVKFSPAVIPTPQYVTIFTSVTDFGGGSITPNMRIVGAGQDVPNAGKAVVEFFPDNGYKVDKVWLNDEEVPFYDSRLSSDMLQLTLEDITLDQRVRVQFAPGDQQNRDKKRINVLATAGAGGSISPAGNFQVYEGSTQSFFIAPSTGYAISKLSVKQGGTALSEDAVKELYTTRNTISIANINKDTDIQVTFDSTASSAVSSYTISTDKEGQGRISPTGPMTVGAGTDVPFTIIPTDGWYVKEIRAIYPNSSNTNGLNLISLYDKDTFTFTLADVRSDATVKVVFGEGEDGKIPGTNEDLPTPPGDDDIIKLNPDNQSILPADKPGAIVSPSLGEIEVVKNPDGPGAAAPVVLTVTVADGYELKDPGIVVKDGNNDITDQVAIDEVGDGVYVVTVPKEIVTPDLKVEVTTEPKSSSSNISETFDVDLSVAGDGYITPGMQKVGDQKATLQVEKGKGQTFSFIPGDGWKLFTVYLNGKPTTLTGNTLTVSNVQQHTTIEAAFSKLGPDEKPPVLPEKCNVIVTKSGDGKVSPMATPDAPIQVFAGSNMTINVQPGAGNKVTATVGSTEVPVIGNTVELTNITAKTTTVNIKFEKDVETEYRTLTVVSSGPGTTSPAGNSLVVKGQAQVMTFVPDTGKKLKSVTVNGVDRTSDVVRSGNMSLNLGAINNNTKVEAVFCDVSELGPNDPGQQLPPSDNFQYWTVTASVPNGGGVLSPGSAKVGNGGQVVFTAIPSNGYVLESVKVDNRNFTNIVDNKTFTLPNITSNTNVVASFKKKNAIELDEFYSVFVSCNAGGSVSPTGAMTVPAGGSQSITIMPDPGYKVGIISVGGQPPITNFTSSSYTLFNITQDTNVVVSFTPLKAGESGTSVLTHDISTSSTVNGRISPEGVTKVADGKNASFTFVPDDGCKLSYVRIDDTDVPGDYIVNNQYIFTDVKENHSLHAVFIKDDGTQYWTVNVGQSANGSITPSERVVVPDREDATFTITPFYGYRIKNIYIGDTAISGAAYIQPNFTKVDVAEGVSYQYSNRALKLVGLQKNAEISATFEKDPTYNPGEGSNTPTYVPISGGTTANPSNSGAGGTTSIGSGGFIEEPGTGASEAEKKPQVTIVPNPGSMVDKVEINYGDGSKTVIDDDGTFEYDENGNLVDSNGTPVLGNDGNNIKYPSQGSPARPTSTKPDAQQVYEQGYVTIDGEKAAETGGVSVDVTFRPITSDEENNLTKPTYYEINASYSGGGRMYPDGRVKVARGQNMIFQMLPSSGYELAALSVDGQDAMKDVTNSRKYIFQNVQDNRSITAAFGFVNNDMVQRYKVTASSNASNGPGVSPTDVSVPDGSDVVVYFLPPENQKVDRVRVTKNNSEVLLDSTSYTSTMYTATNIDGDIHVEVTYAPAGEGDYTWTVQPVRVTSDAPHGNGSVSPREAYVPAGSPQTFFFTPDAGYVVDYVMFNGIATTLKNNPASYSVTPSPDVNADNKLDVYFRQATPQDKQYTTITPEILPGTDGKVHATVEPTSMNVEVGSSVDFYVSPATGHTIKSVKVDGWDVPFKPALPEGQTPVSGAVYSTYIVTLDNVQPGAKIEVETETTSKTPIEIKKHTLTVTGTNVMYTPMGSMQLPEGGKQIITINPLPGYYLDSIMVTENGQQTDITGQLVNDSFTVEMGVYDKLVEIRYLEVGGSEKPSPAYITLGTTKTDNGRDVYATISMQRQGEDLINTLTVDPTTRRLIDSDGNPVEFVRGGNYTFYAAAEPLDGKNLILSGAKFNGVDQNVPNLTGMIANLKVNANGVLDLVFRELKDGEKPIVTRQFNVRVQVVSGSGTVGPTTDSTGLTAGFTVPMGGSTGPISLTPENEHWMIESVMEYSLDSDGNKLGSGRPVDARKYKNEEYDCIPMTDTLIEVSFVQCAIVDVQWDKSLGFVAPNPATDYLKLPVEKTGEPFQFIVAPFENCYVDRFDVTPEEGDTVSYLQDLRQTESVAKYISDGGYSVVSFNPGVGVEVPEGSSEGGEATISTFAIQAMAEGDLDVAPLENLGFIPAKGTAMQNVYGVQANLHPNKTTVNVGLYTLNRNQYYTITPKVKLASDGKPHGEIVPSIPVQVKTSDSTPFRFVPENSNYAVKNIFIDGSPVANASQLTSYTMEGVTHDTTIEVEFAPRSSDESSRLLRVASSLARTGDLTGPAVGALLIVAALGLAVTAISYIRRQQRRRRRMQGMR